jgi:glycosyltransferase involved in cell wall biosynthesis
MRLLFLFEWLARFFHLGAALRIQRLIRGRAKYKAGQKGTVFVHMCAYNGQDTIREAVQSMRAQSHSEWHLLITDDASTDDTWSVIQQLADEDDRIEVARMPENLYQNGKSNRNVGLVSFLAGNWDFYTILDQDDVAEGNWLERCLMIDWKGVYALRMWNARYDLNLQKKFYEYPTAAQIMVPRKGLVGMKYRRSTGVPVDTDFLYRLEYRAVKSFEAIVVAPFLCQKMRFSETNQTANPEAVTIGRWAFFWKYFWSA